MNLLTTRQIWLILICSCSIILFSSFAGLLGHIYWVFDLFSHFRWQYALFSALASLILFRGGYSRWALIMVFLAVLNGAFITKTFLDSLNPTTHVSTEGGVPLRFMSANVLYTNKEYEGFLSYIREMQPDVLAVQEVNPEWGKVLISSLPEFNYQVIVPNNGVTGLALLSKQPILSWKYLPLPYKLYPALQVNLSTPGGQITVIVMHPPPPLRASVANIRDRQIKALSQAIQKIAGPIVVMGDFNTTPWSHAFSKMIQTTNLKNSSIRPTWPSPIFLLAVPIDHILVRGVMVRSNLVGRSIGSDHLPRITDTTLPLKTASS